MAEENKNVLDVSPENGSDFSGNYIEKFEGKKSKDHFPMECESWDKVGNKFYFHSETCSLEISILTNDILKFRYANHGYFEDDFSYAIDPSFKPEAVRVDFKERGTYYAIHTDKVKCYIHKENLKTTVLNLDGEILLKDEKGYHWQDEPTYGGDVVICTKLLRKNESFFGLGDKTGKLNLHGSRKQLWGTDCYGYGNETDPVYKNIPFYIGHTTNSSYGLFMDNSFRSFFDFGSERKNVVSFWAQGGEMRYYFINGPKPLDVTRRFTELTGKASMPPKWALGYHQSKWSYYPEKVVRDLAKEFRDRKIPCDVIHLDIDYMDGFRCFTWNDERFPDPDKMIRDLGDDGFKTVVIIDPGIKVDKNYEVYKQGIENGYFCTRADGALMKGSVWPGLCHFPDFTNPKVRVWWAELFEGLVENGVAGVWNDMNEPAVFEEGTFPIDVRFDYDGHPCSHRKGHNVYGSLMVQSTYNGLKKFQRNKRAFAITRSAYAGIQKYASVWTGDNVASWEHLKIANIQCQRLSASGVSFCGSDVGGFIGTPSAELYVRWIQMAVFHPFFRTHSSGDHGDKEPWIFEEEYTNIVRKFIELRYQLLPYIYTTFWKYSYKGIPMIRSLHLVSPENPEVSYREEEFMFGDHLLVVPVSEEKAESRKLYLPKGIWYNYWTDDRLEGGQEIAVATPLDIIPVFVRAGAIIPKQPVMQYVDEFIYDELTLDVYYSEEENLVEIYEDSGEGMEHKKGEFLVREFSTSKTSSAFMIEQNISGRYESAYKEFNLVFHQFPKAKLVVVDGDDYTNNIVKSDLGYSLIVPKNFKELLITTSNDKKADTKNEARL